MRNEEEKKKYREKNGKYTRTTDMKNVTNVKNVIGYRIWCFRSYFFFIRIHRHALNKRNKPKLGKKKKKNLENYFNQKYNEQKDVYVANANG